MKIKILQFFHSKKLVRIACVLCAMLPLLLVGLFAIPKNQNRITASAAPAYDDVYGDVFLFTGSSSEASYTLPVGTYIDQVTSSSIHVRVCFYSDTSLTTAAVSCICPLVRYSSSAFSQPSNSGRVSIDNQLVFRFAWSDVDYSLGSTFLSQPLTVGPVTLIGSGSWGMSAPDVPGDYPTEIPSYEGQPIPTLESFVVCYPGNTYIYPERPAVYLPQSSLDFLDLFYTRASAYTLANGSGGGDYDEGYNAGYANGYNKGQTDQLVNPLSFFITPVQTFLDTKLFGVVSFGMVLNIVLFVLIATIFIKMFAGG